MTYYGGSTDATGFKGDGEPGAWTLWLDQQKIAVFTEGARYARKVIHFSGIKNKELKGYMQSPVRIVSPDLVHFFPELFRP